MRITIFLILFLLGLNLISQSSLPYRSKGLWGIIDENQKVLLKPQYDYIFNFKNASYSIFLNHNRYGIVDKKGKVVLNAKFKELKIEQGKFFVYKENQEFGLIDSLGNTILEDIYKNIQSIGKDVMIGENDTSKVLLNTESLNSRSFEGFDIQKLKDLFILSNKDSSKLLNKNLEVVFSTKRYNHYLVENGILFYNDEGRFVIPFSIKGIFPKNVVPIANFNQKRRTYIVEKSGKYGVYDISNKAFIIEANSELIEPLNTEYFKLKQQSRCGLIDNLGQEILPTKYADVYLFGDLFYVQNLDYKSGLVQSNGRVVVPIQYDLIREYPNYFEVMMNNKVGVYSKWGAQLEPCAFDLVKSNDNNFKCYSGPIKNTMGKIIKYKKVVSFSLINGEKKGRVEFKNVGIINIESIMSKTQNGLQISADSIYRWKRKKKKLIFDREELKVELWGFRDTTYKRFLLNPFYTKIEVFLDRNYTLAKKYNYGRKSSLSTPISSLQYGGNYELIDHDRVRRYKTNKGYLSLSDVYKNKNVIEFFMGDYFSFFSMDSLKEIRYAYRDEKNEDETIRVAVKGKYRPCSIKDPTMVHDMQGFVSQINNRFNDSVVFTKKNFLGFNVGFKNTFFRLDNASWMLIDENHNLLLDKTYQFISNPIRKKYVSKLNGNWGVMSKEGTLLPHEYNFIERLRDDQDSIFITEKNQFQEFIIDSLGNRIQMKKGIKILSRGGGALVYTEKGKYGLMDGDFKPIHLADFGRLKYIENGWFRYRKKGKMGVISVDGDIIPPNYKNLESINEEYLLIYHKKNKGLINSIGDTIVAPEYENIEVLGHEVLLKKEGKFFLRNLSTDNVKKLKGDFIGIFSSAYVFRHSKSLLLINKKGKTINKLSKSDYIDKSDSLILVNAKGVKKIYNSNFEEVFQGQGEYELLSGPYFVETIKKDKFVRKIGEKKVEDRGSIMKVSKYDHLIVYKNHGKYRIINSLTNEMFHFQHEVAKIISYHGHYFIVQYKNRTQGFCDLKGGNIYNRNFQSCQKFESDFSVVKDKNELKIFTKQGKLVEGLVYHKILPLYKGHFKAQLLKAYGLASENGEILVENEFDKINFSDESLVQLHKEGDVYYYDFEKKRTVK